jgi:hypothetical protein
MFVLRKFGKNEDIYIDETGEYSTSIEDAHKWDREEDAVRYAEHAGLIGTFRVEEY